MVSKKQSNTQVKRNKRDDRSGLFVPAGLFLGMGFGFLLGNFLAFLLIGLGTGFLAMIVALYLTKNQ